MLRGRTGSVFLLGRALEAAGCINPGIPALHGLLFPCPATINQAGREAAAGMVLSRRIPRLLQVHRVISGEPSEICHLPLGFAGLCPGSSKASPFTPSSSSFRVWLQRL